MGLKSHVHCTTCSHEEVIESAALDEYLQRHARECPGGVEEPDLVGEAAGLRALRGIVRWRSTPIA